MTPCPSCRRHVAESDSRCPFCGSAVAHVAGLQTLVRASRAQLWAVAASAVTMTGCPNREEPVNKASNVAAESSKTTQPSASVVASAAPSSSLTQEDLLGIGVSKIPLGMSGTGMAAAYGGPPPSPGLGEFPKTPPANVSVGAATGETTALKSADSVVARNRWRFKACYQKTLSSDPGAEGKLSLAITVGAEGDVTDAKVISSTASAALGTCVAGASRSMKFEAPGKSVAIAVPIVFSSK